MSLAASPSPPLTCDAAAITGASASVRSGEVATGLYISTEPPIPVKRLAEIAAQVKQHVVVHHCDAVLLLM